MYVVDRMNKSCLRNRKNSGNGSYNCGGYALGTCMWEDPFEPDFCMRDDDDESGDEDINSVQDFVFECGYELEDLYENNECLHEVLNAATKYAKNQFIRLYKDNIRFIKFDDIAATTLENNEVVVAFRIALNVYYVEGDDLDDGYYEADEDFHFLLYKDGEWTDKMGGREVRYTDYDVNTEVWETDNYTYNGPILYFIIERPEI